MTQRFVQMFSIDMLKANLKFLNGENVYLPNVKVQRNDILFFGMQKTESSS